MKEGVRTIHRQVLDILKKQGVVRLESVGKEFDPRYHEAVGLTESRELPSWKVGMELRKGYLMGEDLLHLSRVLVVK